MSTDDEGNIGLRNVRSNYFQTEFTVSVKKGRDTERRGNSASGAEDERKKISISIQAGNRSTVGAEESPKERKRWVRPPLVGQASSGSDSQLSIVPAHKTSIDDSDDDIIDSSQEPFASASTYPNRRDYVSEKPPEGSSSGMLENRAQSPASASSLTSGRPLEWDSGADVGYFKAFQAGNGAEKLSSLERMALGGSTSLLARSDPEGTVSNSALPPVIPSSSSPANQNQVPVIKQLEAMASSRMVETIAQGSLGPPDAESTPFQSSKSSGSHSTESGVASHLFPEVIVRKNDRSSDQTPKQSSKQLPPITDDVPKRSSSLEDIVTAQLPAPFVRSQSQNNINFDMNAHLIKLIQPQSNSSSSVATVVKGSSKAPPSDKKESESGSGADGKAHSFEYLPGAAYENVQRDVPPDDPLRKDIERGVQLLSDFVNGTNANNTIMKKKLLKNVVKELLSKKYPGEESWSSAGSTQGQASGEWIDGNPSVPNPPSTWQGLPSAPEGADRPGKPWPVNSWPLNFGVDRCVTRRGHSKELERSEISGESGSQASLMARMDKAAKPAGTSSSTTNSSSVAESSIKQHTQPQPVIRKRVFDPKPHGIGRPEPSSSSSPQPDWKAPVTKSEKIRELIIQKELHRDSLKNVDTGILNFLNCERENQLDWIKKEIDHLSNLKRLLEMHENLKKNFDHLKKTKGSKKDRSQSADNKASRSKRRSVHIACSEPLPHRATTPVDSKISSEENGWDSHDYGGKSKGVLKKNASTNTTVGDPEKKSSVESIKKPVSYTIIFDAKMGKENLRTPTSSQVEISNQVSQKSSGLTIADRDTLMKESRERIKVHLGNLQDELITKNPDYVARAEMRRQTVAEIAAMREVREKNRKNILTAMANGEQAPSIPNPLAVKRVVSQKAMRKLTEKNYRKSSLVKRQAYERKKKEEMVTNRLMADMFNRNLQKRILRGETYLSNSVNIL